MKNSYIKISTLLISGFILAACGGGSSNNPVASPTPAPVTPTPIAASIGLSTSILNESHRFDNPSSRFTINVSDSATVSGSLDYSIKVTNLTNNQPLSPVLVLFHQPGYNAFTDGVIASTAIEYMAEAGDNSFVRTEAEAAAQHLATATTTGPVPPKSSQTLNLTLTAAQAVNLRVTVLSMLVNTNDAFTGLNAMDVSGLSDGDRLVLNGPTWDSGTEANTEAAGTIPGPADGGEGFNSARDDLINIVRFHQGVVTNALAAGNIVR